MTGMHALAQIPDRVTKLSCDFMDARSLGNLAGASSRFRTLVYASDSDFAKIQIALKKYKPSDLGLRIEDPEAHTVGMHNTDLNSRVVRWSVGMNFGETPWLLLPQQLTVARTNYLGRSLNHLFTSAINFEVRDLAGNLLTTIPSHLVYACHELTLASGRSHIALFAMNKPHISLWDITKADAPQKVREHNVPSTDPYALPSRFGDLLVIIATKSLDHSLPCTYDLSHPENPPRPLIHPQNGSFQSFTAHNSRYFYILDKNRPKALAYKMENNTAALSWQIDVEALRNKENHTVMHANDRWLIFSSCSIRDNNQRIEATFNLTVHDAETGQEKGAFSAPLLLTSMTPNHTLHFWGKDILVIKDEKMLHMYQLPSGAPLPALEPESDEIIQAHADTQELTLLYHEKETHHIRACSWTTPLAEAHAAPPPAAEEARGLCDMIYSAIASLFAWIQSLLRKLL